MGIDFTSSFQNRTTIFRTISKHLENGDFKSASNELDLLLKQDISHEQIISCLKVIGFWQDCFDRFYQIAANEHYQKGFFIIKQWIVFHTHFKSLLPYLEVELYGLKLFLFEQALLEFKQINSHLRDEESLLHISRCYKGLDNYEQALRFIDNCFKRNRSNPTVMAEYADLLLLTEHTVMGKLLYKEAFFLDPQRVELAFLESPIILKMIEIISKKEYDINRVKSWIPVYGAIYDAFNIKRGLRTVELGRIKSTIYSLESTNSYLEDPIQKAKLLNHYFWYIDHLKETVVNNITAKDEIDQLLSKIKRVDVEIYKEYTK